MAEWEDYLIKDTKVLKNKLGITDGDELKQMEFEITVSKIAQLYFMGITGNFDEKHLCEIHKFIFEDIYDFAGKYREVDMRQVTQFTPYKEIPSKLHELFNELKNTELNSYSKFETAKNIAKFYSGLIDIHPFREGNGRSIREFIRQLVLAKLPQYELDFRRINKDNFYQGAIDRFQYSNLIAYEFYNALVEKEIVTENQNQSHM